MPSAIAKFCEAIAYPDPVPAEATEARLWADGVALVARVIGTRLVLSCLLDREEEHLARLVAYAAGRLLKEEAVLAWDEKAGGCVLWQECPANASPAQFMRFFENFLNSCDWWLARVANLDAPPVSFPELVIMP